MIAFATAIASEERYRRWALPGIRRAAEPDSLVVERREAATLQENYNAILDELAGREDLEALVLLHEDTEIADDAFAAGVRGALADPEVAVVGVVGANEVDSLAWWEGAVEGRVRVPLLEPGGLFIDESRGRHEVEALDGLLLVLSPWAVRELRFDESFGSSMDGYDVDLCFQARAAGRRVLVEDLDVIHQTTGGFGDRQEWIRADVAFRRKWRAILAAST